MTITRPRTWAVAETLTSGNMNRFVRDIQRALAGHSGPVPLESAIRPGVFTTAARDALTPQEGMLIYNSTTGRLEEYEEGTWRRGLRQHVSPLFAARQDMSVTHDLGVEPLAYQVAVEMVASNHLVYSLGTRIHLVGGDDSITIRDVTASSYTVRVIGRVVTGGVSNNRRLETALGSFDIANDATGLNNGARSWAMRVIAFA